MIEYVLSLLDSYSISSTVDDIIWCLSVSVFLKCISDCYCIGMIEMRSLILGIMILVCMLPFSNSDSMS